MPIFFQQEIDQGTGLAIWKIEEEESFFKVPLQREITHPHKRQQHLAGRYLLQYLVPGFPLELIKIADTRKPYLENEAYHFSISHCGDFAAAIVSKNKRVGVDIEVPSPKVARIRHKFLHLEELQMVSKNVAATVWQEPTETYAEHMQQEVAAPITHLTLLWSAKEAVFKWWSYGSVDFSEMIRLSSVPVTQQGVMAAQFHAPQQSVDLQVNYRLFKNLCLAWVTD